jgi:alcohol dehydrogenase class IV
MSRRSELLADALLMHALRLVRRNLPAGRGTAARTGLVLAAILCGQGTDYSGADVTSALSHATAARHHLENGLLNAILLPHVLRFNAEASRAGRANIAAALELPGPVAEGIAEAVDAQFRALGVTRRLRDVGVPRADLGAIADNAMDDWFLRDSPRPVGDASDLLGILGAAW